MKGQYPTKKEILELVNLPTPREMFMVSAIRSWFPQGWKHLSKGEQSLQLVMLLLLLSDHPPQVIVSDVYMFDNDNTIYIDQNHPSIISALHEFIHYEFKAGELLACAYSVKLFKEAFPEMYGKLKWKGHMLTKQP